MKTVLSGLETSQYLHELVLLELAAMGYAASRLVSQPTDGGGAIVLGDDGGLHAIALPDTDWPEVEIRRMIGVQLAKAFRNAS
ncbi:MAG TPA: hypothetical protein VGQ76_22860 [Thermoanaerobaculia bacterium]|jgi:hypothetical protein|nr:hypothetical protein [Thermoanaerobaculia bacterium]